jgi:hypothetical protein
MAYSGENISVSLNSSGDMSGKQYACVVASTTNNNQGCILQTTLGGTVTGIYQNNSTAAEFGKVVVIGHTKVIAGSSSGNEDGIVAGGLLTVSTVSQAIPSSGGANDSVFGMALEVMGTASTGVISALVLPTLNVSTST